MRSVEDQIAHVLSLATRLPARTTPLTDGFGGVLAEDLTARFDVPPFDNSAMDGFAVRAADLGPGVQLRVVGDVPAGATRAPYVGEGQAARIMTGAPLPEGADTVVPVEATDQPWGAVALPDAVTILEPVTPGRHIRRRAENIRSGQPGLLAGLRWSAAAASAAASLGYAEVPLVLRPRVAVIATGTELVAPGEPLGFGQIPDSNSALISGLVRQFGGEVVLARAVDDDPDRFRKVLAEALEADVIVSSGGVSVGAFEVVRQVTGEDLEFVNVAMQPGKPQAAGLVRAPDGRGVPMLGLPGNPVSVFVSAWVYLRPLIAALGGWDAEWPSLHLPALEGWKTPPRRRQYIPVKISGTGVAPVHRFGSGSHLVASLAQADALAVVPADVDTVDAGDLIEVKRTDV